MTLQRLSCALELSDTIKNNIQRSFGDDSRVKLFERAGGRVSRIGKWFLARGFAFGIEFLETGFGEINLAPHLHQVRTGLPGVPAGLAPQPPGDTADRLQIHRDVIARGPVAARGATSEYAFFVAQVDGDPIALRLDHPIHFFIRQQPLDALNKFPEFLLRVRVVQAEHWLEVLDRLESFERFASDTLGWRIR